MELVEAKIVHKLFVLFFVARYEQLTLNSQDEATAIRNPLHDVAADTDNAISYVSLKDKGVRSCLANY